MLRRRWGRRPSSWDTPTPGWITGRPTEKLSQEGQMNRKGFTLIELLIVVVIIGILAAIAIPKFANTEEKAYLASMKSDLRNLVTAEEAYFCDSVKYSATIGAGGITFTQSTGNTLPAITTTSDGWRSEERRVGKACGSGSCMEQ